MDSSKQGQVDQRFFDTMFQYEGGHLFDYARDIAMLDSIVVTLIDDGIVLSDETLREIRINIADRSKQVTGAKNQRKLKKALLAQFVPLVESLVVKGRIQWHDSFDKLTLLVAEEYARYGDMAMAD